MRISEDLIKEITYRNDIIDVLDEFLTLKKNGSNYIALCPFHNEKTPSFVVSREKQIFKCFGCGESGNVISFIMKYKALGFVDSIKFLASRAGVSLELDSQNSNLNKYYIILNDTARYFYINLKKNKRIKQYLLDRGLSEAVIIKFGLGYSLDNFTDLMKYLQNKGYSEEDLLELGLISSKNKKYYDRFIDRIMFPIFNSNGHVIGFGGRVINDRLPKYLNSKESRVFKKGHNLYGLNFLLKEGNKFDYLIIVEGYMDCISLHNHGITNSVASLGTALTIDQIKLLMRYTNKFYLCFDGDLAGRQSAFRTFNLFKKFISENLIEVYVVELNGAKDPDEYLNKYSSSEFLGVLAKSVTLVEYVLRNYCNNFDLTTNFGKKKYLSTIKNIIEELNVVDRNYYIKLVSSYLSISEDSINSYFNNNNLSIKSSDVNFNENFIEKAHIKSERQLLNLMLNKEYLTYILNNNVDENLFSTNEHKKAFKLICDFNEDGIEILDYLESRLTSYEEIKLIIYFKENIKNYDNNNIVSQIDDFIKVLRKNIISKFKGKIARTMKEYESIADEDSLIEYLSIFNTISKLEREGNLSEAMDFIRNFKV